MKTISRGSGRVFTAACAVVMALAVAEHGRAEALDAVLYRIFLADGSSLVSYGEYSRVGDQVVFSLPLGIDVADPRLHLVSIPSTTVDWRSTERYAESARSAHYGATRGESDFALMSSDVARALNEVALTAEPARRLEVARVARNTLRAWPEDHFGYRAADVQQIAGLLDEVISEIRLAAGQQSFDLDFVAMASAPPPMPLLPPPSLQETIAQALGAARRTRVPAERISLLRATMGLLDESAAVPSSGAEATRALVTAELEAELVVERAYADLTRTTLEQMEPRAVEADVRGLEQLRREVLQRDSALSGQRPNQLRALLSMMDSRLDAARRLRLERDRWNLRIRAYRGYQRALRDLVYGFVRSKAGLEDIRALAGPDADVLARLGRDLGTAEDSLQTSVPPVELQTVHDLMMRALQLPRTAVDLRREAIRSSDMDVAWDASAAASGAMMLFSQAQSDLQQRLRAPDLR